MAYLWNSESLVRDGKAYALLPLEAVVVAGPDRLAWLHNITTAPFLSLAPGMSIEGLLLDHSGHILHACAAVDDGAVTWLLTDEGRSSALAEYLQKMRFMMRVEIEEVPVVAAGVMLPAHSVTALLADNKAIDTLPAAGVPAANTPTLIWEDPWPHTAAGGASYGISDEDHPAKDSHRTLIIARDVDRAAPESMSGGSSCGSSSSHRTSHWLIQTLNNAGLEEVPLDAWEAMRIMDRRPRPNTEIMAGEVLPHELDWLRTAVSLTKGCFPGNETVAKVVNMGKPPKRAVFLYLEGPEGEMPSAGSEVTLEGVRVGVLTSVGRDDRYGPVALALVKRSVPLEAVLCIEDDNAPGFVASQELIVSPQGRSSASPDYIPGADLRKARAAMGADEKPRPRNDRG